MKLTGMFENSSEASVVKCSHDGESSEQSGAILAQSPAESNNLPASISKLKDRRSSPDLEIPNGNSDIQADLKKTLEPLLLNNGDCASSDDMERISCRTPVDDNDSSSEKENYLFDDGGSEASLKLRITESDDESDMSPRAGSPFEDQVQSSRNPALPQTEETNGAVGESEDTEQNCDKEEQENETAEPEVSSTGVEDQEDETSLGKLLKSDEQGGTDSTCVQKRNCQDVHHESHGSDGCHPAELVEPEKSELCCDIVSDPGTVKCSCDGVCSSTCTCSVLKQEVDNGQTPLTESNVSLEINKGTAEHSGTHNGEQSGSLNMSDSHVNVKNECSSNIENGFPEECSSSTVLSMSEPTVSETKVTSDIVQTSSVDKEKISEDWVTESKTTGGFTVTKTLENEQSSAEKLISSISGKNVQTPVDDVAHTNNDLLDGNINNGEDGDSTFTDQDCKPGIIDRLDKTKTMEVLPVEIGVNGSSTVDADINSRESVSSVSNNNTKADGDESVHEVCVKNKNGVSDCMKDSEMVLRQVENELAGPQNSATITNSLIVPDNSAPSNSEVSLENSELTENALEAISVNPLDDKKADAKVASAISQSHINKKICDPENVDGTEVLYNGPVDDACIQDNDSNTGAVIKEKELVTQESCSSECDDNAVNNESKVQLNQISSMHSEDSELNINGSELSVDLKDQDSESSREIDNGLEIGAGSVKEELCGGGGGDGDGDCDSGGDERNMKINKVLNETSEFEGKIEAEVQDSVTSTVSEAELESLVKPPVPDADVRETEVRNTTESELLRNNTERALRDAIGASAETSENEELEPLTLSDVTNAVKENITETVLERNNTAEISGDATVASTETCKTEGPNRLSDVASAVKDNLTETDLERNNNAGISVDATGASAETCENEEPLTLSDVANALKDAVDTVTLQDGESVPFTSCEASVPPLSSELLDLPASDMLNSDNTSAMADHVADQEVQDENVQEAPGIAEAVRRRRKRSVEDSVPDRISKRTRGSIVGSSSGASSPEKPVQTSAESAKRSVLDSPEEEDAKRVRLSEEYSEVVKKIEQTVAPNGVITEEAGSRRIFLEKIRARDLKGLTVAELEEFFVEKICEALAYRHELGIMRQKQQAVENQMELWRKKTLAVCKQIRDMELVMKRYQNDLKIRKDRPVIPVKVTRSVGLQVHVGDVSTDTSSRPLLHKRKRLEQQVPSLTAVQRPSPQTPLPSNNSTVPTTQSASVSTRGTTSLPQYSRTATSTNSQTTVPVGGTRVQTKPNSGIKTLMPRQQSVNVSTNTSSATSPTTVNSSRAQQMTRSKAAYATANSPVGTVNKSPRQVIDLTDDGERGRTGQPRTTASVNTNPVSSNNSGGVPTTLTPTSTIRILPQPVPVTAVAAGTNILTTGVTNSAVPRLTYLVPTTNQLQQRPVLLASSPSQVTVTGGQKNPAPAVFVKSGAVVSVSPIVGSGAVGQQVTPSARPASLQQPGTQGSPGRPQVRPSPLLPVSPQSRNLPQHAQHPAPLPVAANLNLNNPDLKKMPPRPELKISKQSRHQGIVLSWNMPVTNEYAAIASYQLYAYQESSSPPSTAHWKKVGDVKALPLPMACTLTQFVEGHKYHFAVRAVDIHSRVGPFSLPGSIVLTRKS